MRSKWIEFIVGLFMLVGIAALVVLAFRVSGLTGVDKDDHYTLVAQFDNVGDLKVRAPVSISGVTVGRVSSIELDPNNFRAKVILQIQNSVNTLPVDTSASIFTQGILGSNYISLSPGFEDGNLKSGDQIRTTHPALILENLIGQLIYSLKGESSDNHSGSSTVTDKDAATTSSN